MDIQVKLEEIAREVSGVLAGFHGMSLFTISFPSLPPSLPPQLKHRCSDDHAKMQSLLPELLVTHGVPTFTLTPVYNPR